MSKDSEIDTPQAQRSLADQFPVSSLDGPAFGGVRKASVGTVLFTIFVALLYFFADYGSAWSLYVLIAIAAGGIVWLFGVPTDVRPEDSAAKHPDPDVQALIDNRITISEYRRRKESSALVAPTRADRSDA